MSSATFSALAAITGASATVISGLLYLARLWIRVRAERDRWATAERLAERHGPQILTLLPRLARELRDTGNEPAPTAVSRPRRRAARRGIGDEPGG